MGSVLAVMRSLRKSGMTMIVVSREMGFARAAADRVVLIDQGLIVDGASRADLRSPKHDRTRPSLARSGNIEQAIEVISAIRRSVASRQRLGALPQDVPCRDEARRRDAGRRQAEIDQHDDHRRRQRAEEIDHEDFGSPTRWIMLGDAGDCVPASAAATGLGARTS